MKCMQDMGGNICDCTIQKCFDSKPWYHLSIGPEIFNKDVFNDYERANKETLEEGEEQHGWREKKPSDLIQP